VRKTAATALGLLVVAVGLLLGAMPASGATAPPTGGPTGSPGATPGATEGGGTAEGELIRARVRTEDRQDVEGVTITVEAGGKQVAEGTTDAKGIAEIAVPEAGDYTVALDTDTLPSSAEGLEPQRNPIETTVRAGDPRVVAFRLVEAGTAPVAADSLDLRRLPQLTTSGLRFGLIIALAAIGLSLIFGTTGLTNFAHGELVTFGALTAYFVHVLVGLPLVLAGVVTLVLAGVFGYLNDRLLWAPLRRRGTGLVAMMIVSIGLAIFLRYFYLYIFGGSTRSYADYQGQRGVPLGPITLRPLDYISMAIAIVVLVAVGLALLRTRLGKATRAVADNPALAAASGIDVDRVIRTVWIGGTALAGLSGILLGLAQQVSFQMGLQILLLVFAAVVLGGLGTAFGALVGSLVVGVFIEVSTLFIPTELKNVGALAILIVVLLVRPQGVLGRAERVG
jgi:branched-chain amino acid transport system permease protein